MKIDVLKGSFGYPVLQEYRYDYFDNDGFKFEITRTDEDEEKIVYDYKYDLSSSHLSNLSANGVVQVLVHLEQKSYRNVIICDSNEGQIVLEKVKFAPDYKITLLPVVVAKNEMEFFNPEFEVHEIFEGIESWVVDKGAVLAVGEEKTIAVNQEPSSYSSIIKIRRDSELSEGYKIALNKKMVVLASDDFLQRFNKAKNTKMVKLYLLKDAYSMAMMKFLNRDPEEELSVWEEFVFDKLRTATAPNEVTYEELMATPPEDRLYKSQELVGLLINKELNKALDHQIELITIDRGEVE